MIQRENEQVHHCSLLDYANNINDIDILEHNYNEFIIYTKNTKAAWTFVFLNACCLPDTPSSASDDLGHFFCTHSRQTDLLFQIEKNEWLIILANSNEEKAGYFVNRMKKTTPIPTPLSANILELKEHLHMPFQEIMNWVPKNE